MWVFSCQERFELIKVDRQSLTDEIAMRAECEAAVTSPLGNAKELLLSESTSGTQVHEFVIEINSGPGVASLGSSRNEASQESQAGLDSSESGLDRNSSGNSESECANVCRVCHISLAVELIELGCSCKQELGLVHQHCAQAWFKIKGNRICEICGQVAKNVVGMSELGRPSGTTTTWTEAMALEFSASRFEERRFWHNRHLCHFIFSFLVVLVLLPCLFRLNLFKM